MKRTVTYLSIPKELRRKIENIAKSNGRTLTAQIVWMLQTLVESQETSQ